MTLTEEQREAIRASVCALEMANRCPRCHKYLKDNFIEHIAVIRAMIDSSGTVGFDLEKNRAAIDSAINSLLCEGWDNEASTVRRLVAEIERLRASLVEHEEHENQTHEVLGNILGTDDTLENVAKRAAARIKELEDALVEELARGDYFDESQECEGYWWDRKNTSDCTQNDYRRNARLKLQAKGKIGPDARPPYWQITEERIEAL